MRSPTSPPPTARSRRLPRIALATALVVSAGVVARPALRGVPRADACGWYGPSPAELSTFDPQVVDDVSPSLYRRDQESAIGFGPCDDCGDKAMAEDWRGFLAGAVTDSDWSQVLHHATAADLAAIDGVLAGRQSTPPAGFEHSSLWKPGAPRDKLRAAVAVIELARRAEASLTLERTDDSGNRTATPAPDAALLADAQTRARTAREPFLKQRYAFAALRLLFYRREWAAAVAYLKATAATLAGPSTDLAWRARYYVAGAARRGGDPGRALLELARIYAGSEALAGAALDDFKPREEADWQAALALAKDPKDQALLWSMAGIKGDGVAAIREILKIAPGSDRLALLVVREVTSVEEGVVVHAWDGPDAKVSPDAVRAYRELEELALKISKVPGADRPWLMELVAGHLAAKRGDLAAARPRLLHAATSHPTPLVTSQAKASLAVALAMNWQISPVREDELATNLAGVREGFGKTSEIRAVIRGKLAAAYAKAGREVDATFLDVGGEDPVSDLAPAAKAQAQARAARWADPTFIRSLIARTGQARTPFDRFVLEGSYSRAQLGLELGLNLLVHGDFARAQLALKDAGADPATLGTDPFVIHIVDCHDCDHDKFAKAPWTRTTLAARLAELEKTASGSGEPAAVASLALGNALYNVTWSGNARVVLESSHQTADARAAERWYKRAFDLTTNRELKTKAAFMAAKAELAALEQGALGEDRGDLDNLPIPTTWFPVVKRFADTKYYNEILKECGHFKRWVKAP